ADQACQASCRWCDERHGGGHRAHVPSRSDGTDAKEVHDAADQIAEASEERPERTGARASTRSTRSRRVAREGSDAPPPELRGEARLSIDRGLHQAISSGCTCTGSPCTSVSTTRWSP